MSEGVSKRTLYAAIVILVVMVLGQVGWLMVYRATTADLEGRYAVMDKTLKELQTRILELQSRISDEAFAGFLAYRHWTAITTRDLNGVMSQYAPDAKLYWLGCSLEGNFTDMSSIQAQWKRFFAAQPLLCMNVSAFSVRIITGFHAGFTGAVVNARVSFCCPNSTYTALGGCGCTVNIGLVYMLREGKWFLVDEWWAFPPRWHPYISY